MWFLNQVNTNNTSGALCENIQVVTNKRLRILTNIKKIFILIFRKKLIVRSGKNIDLEQKASHNLFRRLRLGRTLQTQTVSKTECGGLVKEYLVLMLYEVDNEPLVNNVCNYLTDRDGF